MKKKLSYRDKLLELANIYSVKEILEYVKNKKNLTTNQLEFLLKNNNIAIPKDLQTNFFKDNFTKPISKFRNKFYKSNSGYIINLIYKKNSID